MRVLLAIALLAQVAIVLSQRGYEYNVPRPSLKAINPKGFRLSIRDRAGIEKVTYHVNINKPLSRGEPGEYTEELTRPQRGRWALLDYNKQLNSGDNVYFWISVLKDGKEYRYDDGKILVTESAYSSEESGSSSEENRRY